MPQTRTHHRFGCHQLRPYWAAPFAVLLFLLWMATGANAFPRTVIDGTGAEIVLDEPPQRIFSTAAAIDNILLSVVDPERVVAVTIYATLEGYSYVADRVAPHMMIVETLNGEQVLAANPDIVLVASWNDPDAVAQIKSLGMNVYTFTAFGGIEDALENIARIGEITGAEAEAQKLIDEFYRKYGEIAARIAGREKPTVLYWNDWGSTAGTDTAVDGIIRYAGGENIAATVGIEGWQIIDAEFILQLDPDVIITDANPEFAARLENDPVLESLTAVRTGRVYYISHTDALNHHFILAIEELARKLHPDAFVEQ